MFTLTARLKLFRHTRRYRPSIPPTAIITVSFAQFKMSSEEDGYLWSFGYGSNMDVTALQAKKHVKIKGKFAERLVSFNRKERKVLHFIISRTYSCHSKRLEVVLHARHSPRRTRVRQPGAESGLRGARRGLPHVKRVPRGARQDGEKLRKSIRRPHVVRRKAAQRLHLLQRQGIGRGCSVQALSRRISERSEEFDQWSSRTTYFLSIFSPKEQDRQN